MSDIKMIREAIEATKHEFLADLDKVIQIASVKADACDGAPFGQANRQVLAVVMDLAERYGFKTKVVENAVGYAQLGDETEYIGIVGHLDVVPAGTGWSVPPYELTQVDEVLYGRGILDNKGPVMACLFGLKLLRKLNVPLKKNIRIIFGTDEESGSSDLPLYLANEKPPVFGFTPDCKYPVVYGERGIVNVSIKTKIASDSLRQLSAIEGEQSRAFVPDELSCQVGERIIAVKGKRSPSNAPELGRNGITLLAKKLVAESAVSGHLLSYFDWLIQCFDEKHHGEGLGLDFADKDSGSLMLTPYCLEKSASEMVLSVAIRYPVSVTEEEVLERLSLAVYQDSQLEVVRRIPGTLFPKDHPGVQTLAKVYEKITGMDGTPVTTTGATYARFMPNIVAFGPSFPGQKGIAHNADEYMDLADLLKNMEIYMHAIMALAND